MTEPLIDFDPVELIETDDLPTGVTQDNHFSEPDPHDPADIYTSDVIVEDDDD